MFLYTVLWKRLDARKGFYVDLASNDYKEIRYFDNFRAPDVFRSRIRHLPPKEEIASSSLASSI